MNRYLIVSGIAVLLICVGLSGCNETTTITEIDKFVGIWGIIEESDSPFEETNVSMIVGEVTFYKNGTGTSSNTLRFLERFNFSISNGKILVSYPYIDYIVSYEYTFSENDTKLTLIDLADVSEIELIKQ